jgi:hypothetical protein
MTEQQFLSHSEFPSLVSDPWVFKNMVLRRIFGPKSDEVTGEWRKLRNEELHDPICSPTIVWVAKSRRMRWAEHVAQMGERSRVYRVLVGNAKEKDQWGDPGVDGRIILRWNFGKWDVMIWIGLGCIRIETGGGHL